jgi:hypothetical protein
MQSTLRELAMACTVPEAAWSAAIVVYMAPLQGIV